MVALARLPAVGWDSMGLLGRDPSVAYRGGLLPYLQRTVTDPIDDVSEYEQLEWALPGLPGLLEQQQQNGYF